MTVKEPAAPTALERLTEEVASLARLTDSIDRTMQREEEERERRFLAQEKSIRGQKRITRWALIIAAGSALIALIAIVAVIVAIVAASEAKVAASDSKAALAATSAGTVEARISVCLNANDQAEKAKQSDKREFRKLVTALAPHPTPQVQARITRFFADPKEGFDVLADHGHPLRDCSPAGIAAFYASGPSTTSTSAP